MVGKLYNCDCALVMDEIRRDISRKYCVVTDPPFNIGYHYKTYKDKMRESEYYKWIGGIVGDCCVVVHYPESICRLAIEKNAPPPKEWCHGRTIQILRDSTATSLFGVLSRYSRRLRNRTRIRTTSV